MPEKLKDLFFSKGFIEQLTETIQQIYPDFDKEKLLQAVYDEGWENRELKARMRHLSHCLHAALPPDYPEALEILLKVAPLFEGFDAMVFPDYVESYGLGDWERSLPALAVFTRQASSEFAIRPFLAQNPERAMSYLAAWAEDENVHVRRLASEGCRPRLPWAMALPAFKKDPALILPVLEKLKDDESDYVRRSVANNLNDISKDHPDLVLDLCQRWYGQTKNTDWIVKHACRSLLKGANEKALRLFSFAEPTGIKVEDLTLDKPALSIGEAFRFSFKLNVNTGEPCQLRLEYRIHFVKSSGKSSPKVFQLKEDNFKPGDYLISRKHSFEDRTTRKHHPGQHQLSIIVNGVELAKAAFKLGPQSA